MSELKKFKQLDKFEFYIIKPPEEKEIDWDYVNVLLIQIENKINEFRCKTSHVPRKVILLNRTFDLLVDAKEIIFDFSEGYLIKRFFVSVDFSYFPEDKPLVY